MRSDYSEYNGFIKKDYFFQKKKNLYLNCSISEKLPYIT